MRGFDLRFLLAGSALGDPSAHPSTGGSGRFSRLTSLGSAAQTGFWLGQQTALHTKRITNIESTDPTVGDQDLTQELPGLLLLVECVAELRLRDQAHLDQNLTQQTPRLFVRPHSTRHFGIALAELEFRSESTKSVKRSLEVRYFPGGA